MSEINSMPARSISNRRIPCFAAYILLILLLRVHFIKATSDSKRCESTQFQCKHTKRCLPQNVICDGKVDCYESSTKDDSDEDNPRCKMFNICPNNYFTCKDNITCIPLNHVCDKMIDCKDGSDESHCEADNLCPHSKCSYGCKPTSSGTVCYCPQNKYYEVEANKCVDADECLIEGACDQLCTNTDDSFECSCVDGYELYDQTKCRARKSNQSRSSDDPIILMMTHHSIRKLNMNETIINGDDFVSNLTITAYEFDHKNGKLYWISQETSVANVKSANISSLSKDVEVISSDQLYLTKVGVEVDLMKLDWITGNWYFSTSHYDSTLIVCGPDFQFCTNIDEFGTNGKPHDMALDPTVGLIFVTYPSRENPSIVRMRSDGSGKAALASDFILKPYLITLDLVKKHVFWTDIELSVIAHTSYEGDGRPYIVIKSSIVNMLTSFVLFEQYIYAVSSDKALHKINRYNKSDVSIIKKSKHNTTYNQPVFMKVYHRLLQPPATETYEELNTICKRNNGDCDQICVPIVLKMAAARKCLCSAGYKLINDKKCQAIVEEEFIMFVQVEPPLIRSVTLDGRTNNMLDVFSPVASYSKPILFDYDALEKFVYFYSVFKGQQQIIKQAVDEPFSPTIFAKEGLQSTSGLAFDSFSGNIYVLNQKASSIAVIRKYNSEIKRKTVLLPRAMNRDCLIASSKNGQLFWITKFIHPDSKMAYAIMTMDMDLTNLRQIFDFSTTSDICCLAIDPSEKMLFWYNNRLKAIEVSNLDGTERKIKYDKSNLGVPIQLAVGKETLVWVDSHDNLKFLKISHPNTLYKEISIYKGIGVLKIVSNASVSSTSNPCEEFNGGCDDFCLLYPSNSSVESVCGCADDTDVSECVCRNGLTLDVDDRVCVNQTQAPIDNGNKCGLDFQCATGDGCIDAKYLCDGSLDCVDGSDENDAPGSVCNKDACPENSFQCGTSHLCTRKEWVCDGDPDCPNAEDETITTCSSIECRTNEFRCAVSKRCIPRSWTCDNKADCGHGDNSDETKPCPPKSCEFTEFQCADGHCIGLESICNGIVDCDDESDEKSCGDIRCNSTTQFKCKATKQCLHIGLRCNGVLECHDGSDETNCSKAALSKLTCHDDEFPCNDGRCIPTSFKCNFNEDCWDGSDEANCDIHTCKEFLCYDEKSCIPNFWRCDGFQDCEDNSDEINCKPKFECAHPNLKCDNETKCVDVTKICDENPDCDDGTDEGDGCSPINCFNADCDALCQNTPDGHICYCPVNQSLSHDKKTCLEAHPCDVWGTCSQNCQQFQFIHKCFCQPGYALEPDLFSCKSTDPAKPFIIYSNRHELRIIDLDSFSVKSILPGLKNTIALDFYHSNEGDVIFWTDVIDDKIYKASLVNQSVRNIEVVLQGLTTAEGLAIDWIGENLYWVESNLDQIEVSKMNGLYRKTLIAGNMESPRAIALDPRYGVLFWSDWDPSSPRIESASMSGDNRKVVFRVDSIPDGAWPNGLTLDFVARRIYWIDAKSNSVHTTKYDGTEHYRVLQGHFLLSHPFSITLYENFIYWTDWRTNSVSRANKWNGSNIEVVERTVSQPFGIHVLHPSRQPRDVINPCGNNNGGCSHLCLLNFNSTYRCHCPHLMKLDKDNKICIKDDLVLLFSRPQEILGIDIESPFYYIIPPLGKPQMAHATQIDFDAKTERVYWLDSHLSQVKRSALTGISFDTVIDTKIQNPYGFAIDWLSRNMFITSYDETPVGFIYAMNLDGEYFKKVLEKPNMVAMSMVVQPVFGKMYWADHYQFNHSIWVANMDGSDSKKLITVENDPELLSPQSLAIDYEDNYLYWVNLNENPSLQRVNLNSESDIKVETVELPANISSGLAAVTVYRDHLIYATPAHGLLHYVPKNNPKQYSILRNNTYDVIALKVYDESLQQGHNPCSKNKGNCSQLCLPVSSSDRVCACAIGYQVNQSDPTKCVADDNFILYSINYEILGIPLEVHDNETYNLVPISSAVMITVLDYVAELECIYWVDKDEGSINRIKRDGTGREVIVSLLTSIEGMAIDSVAKNIYWINPDYDVIEVARLNGSSRYVVVTGDMDKPKAIVVSSTSGFMFWSDWGKFPKIERATLDGKNRIVLVNDSIQFVSDLAIDKVDNKLYWCDQQRDTIERVNFDGTNRQIVINGNNPASQYYSPKMKFPVALSINADYIYYIDSAYQQGSINRVDKYDVTDFVTIKASNDELFKDIVVYRNENQERMNPCAINNGGCQELCFHVGNDAVVCACAHGKIAADGKTCEDYDAFLIYSKVLRISSLHLIEHDNQNAPFPDIGDRKFMRNVIGVAFDFKSKRIFYSDIQLGSINSVFFNGSDHRNILENKQELVEGLAFDSMHDELYWTSKADSSINRFSVRPQLGRARPTKIIKLSAGDKPRGIAVDSCQRYIFWTNWNTAHPSLQRSSLSGYDIRSIVTSDILMPNAITIDYKAQKLYWSDARLDKIERCDMNGQERYVLIRAHPQHSFDLAIYGEYIFWSDWVRHAILRANKFTGEEVTVLRRNIPRVMGVAAVSNDSQSCELNPCYSTVLKCEDLCDVHSNGTAYCRCIRGRQLQADGLHCVSSGNSCYENEFQCRSGQCIPFHLTCEGISDCPDQEDEDEEYCDARKCIDGYFRCKNNRCIREQLVCDQKFDCGDDSDEVNCTCSSKQFKCNNGMCIDRQYQCDRDADCPDASDEMGCDTKECGRPNLAEEMPSLIPCNTTTACILKDWICDGHNDCWDNSDEQNCTITPPPACPSNYFRCKNSQCIPNSWECDRHEDCHDNLENGGISTDETNCSYVCKNNQFKCNNSECIPAINLCDGKKDCSDGSDEYDDCKVSKCLDNEVKCNNTGLCVPEAWICDGDNDCGGNISEDEHADRGCVGFVCQEDEFQCSNMECILKMFYCDRENDCGDNSDEPETCIYRKCTEDQFECGNKRCIPKMWVCNGINDCDDKSDEAKCKNQSICAADQFKCLNDVCLNKNLLCNGQNDCGDFSDEESCDVNECETDIGFCSQICTDKVVGFECACRPGFHLIDDRICEDIDECEDQYPCSHFCRNTYGSYVCSCAEGYISVDGHRTCKANTEEKPMIVFSNRYYIREIPTFGSQSTNLLAQNLTNAVALDFDWQEKCLYWSETTTLGSSIKRMCENTPGHQIIHVSTIRQPDGIAVDWIGRNLYWCDKGRDTIEVSKLDGRFRKVVINKGLEEPRAIVLDPEEGYMYWTDWGERAYIGKAGMDGSNSKIIVNNSLGWPNALTIDYVTRELFWADARQDYIAMTDLDGHRRRIIKNRETGGIHHIFSLTVFENSLYWTDWETKSIEKCDKYSGENHATIAKTIHRPMDLQIHHPYRQPALKRKNPCENNGGCSTLCLLSPDLTAKCVCPENFVLSENNKSCTPNCSSSQSICEKTFKCISFWWYCDTQDDCGDGSDEPDTCPPYKCIPGQFQCLDGSSCTHPSQICDGVAQCEDESDERNCHNHTCLPSQYKCAAQDNIPSRCIQSSYKCDGYADCPLKDDELNCAPKECKSNEMKCNNSVCVTNIFVCDGDDDCGDNSDEPDTCVTRTCAVDEFRCNTGRCIPNSWYCDGEIDCKAWEDEPQSCSEQTCDPTYVLCNNTRCIPGRWRCDFDDDCGDNSDEIDCLPRNCSESEFRCGDGRCIRGSLRCNGEYTCEDMSDEMNCNQTCAPNHFQCKNPPFCIHDTWRCDHDIDCADGSDEEGCDISCGSSEFQCKSNTCINYLWQCDGESDCPDGSDEDEELCKYHNCLLGRSRCANNKCVPRSLFCDGIDHCGDNSDEDLPYCKRRKAMCDFKDAFQCDSGHCIMNSFVCDGHNDCGDSSDEAHCGPCKFRSCSQLCFAKNHENYTCGCAEGYTSEWSKSVCTAKGDAAVLMIASDNELKKLNPYKPQVEGTENILDEMAQSKTRLVSVDVMFTHEYSIAFWTDFHQKSIIRFSIVNEESKGGSSSQHLKRAKRQDSLTVVHTGLSDPKGITIDWVTDHIYWTDSGLNTISVSNFDGSWVKTLLASDIINPQDIVVDPESSQIFWTELRLEANIQSAKMDGSSRAMLRNTGVIWPSGLAIDYPSRHLYWVDAKLATIYKMDLDGSNHVKVRSANKENYRPFKIDVFEDYLFVTTIKHNIMKLHKFGLKEPVNVVKGLNRASDLVIVQEYKQTVNISNPCRHIQKACDSNSECLMRSPTEGICICRDGYVAQNTSESEFKCVAETKEVECSLTCYNGGTCYIDDQGQQKCRCYSEFAGDDCLIYRCSNYCKNHGFCYSEIDSNNPDGPALLKCNCPSQYTGDRCEIPSHLCDSYCQNKGVCYIGNDNKPKCGCIKGFTGQRCEVCTHLNCQNNAPCQVDDNGLLKCVCPVGYTGKFCERSTCDGFCNNNSFCELDVNGVPSCKCHDGFSGDRCDNDLCKGHCLNKGTCVRDNGVANCKCTKNFIGKRCQKRVNNSLDVCKCLNGGRCITIQKNRLHQKGVVTFCSCPSGFDGDYCQIMKAKTCEDIKCMHGGTCSMRTGLPSCLCKHEYVGRLCETRASSKSYACNDFCLNGATCTVSKTKLDKPHCTCTTEWTGSRCHIRTACYGYCHNGGTCMAPLNQDGNPFCLCTDGYLGPRCDSPMGSSSCNGYCLHGGTCISSGSPRYNATCNCKEGWGGKRCSVRTSCKGFCYNGGICTYPLDEDDKPSCRCKGGFYGPRCTSRNLRATQTKTINYTYLGIGVVLAIAVIALVILIIIIYKRRKRTQFMHMRMQDTSNVEISNPMYLREECDDGGEDEGATFNLNSDKISNVQNPLYNSIYENDAEGISGRSEEKKGLLQHDKLKIGFSDPGAASLNDKSQF